jgi:hypothetical protein
VEGNAGAGGEFIPLNLKLSMLEAQAHSSDLREGLAAFRERRILKHWAPWHVRAI